ncbi:YuiB family protein [Aquibacillus koreensis]|uniref:YuiB family protein n=1 Tax=Aquibacillus koreensis TaxID=279446 RepID=A0A9X3WKI6_9BACI|nr:YuiB family protein [Aquibacillus koreensis]MCT2535874.1 YuiB family protein [Aquibacillus koreensis]MDC3420330.1 YuiB family protein [Aquibacillus koreensis]
MIQLVVSLVIYFVLFFGISFILNMLLRRTWIMSFFYPIVVLLIVDDFAISYYFTNPISAFTTVWSDMTKLNGYDIAILLSGLIGTIASGIVIKKLRKSGYQMF